jgi:hypothetical protein
MTAGTKYHLVVGWIEIQNVVRVGKDYSFAMIDNLGIGYRYKKSDVELLERRAKKIERP